MPKLSRPVRLLLKTAFSAIAIGGLIAGIHWQELPQLLVGYKWEFALAAFIGLAIQFPISGLKWHAALRVCNVDLSFTRLTRFYCISHFAGQFLPTSIGGDAYRVFRVLPLVEPHSRALTSIVIDRIVGLAALLFLGAVGSVFLIDHFRLPQGYLTALGFGSVAAVIGAIALYLGWFGVLRRKLQHSKMVATIQVYLLFLGAGSDIGFAEVALIAAVTGLAGILPLAINDLCGVLYWRESHGGGQIAA